MSNSLRPCGLQHARLPCPALSLGVCSNSHQLSWWSHPITIICHPLLLLASVFPSIRIFSNELALCISWPRYWSFSTSPSNEYSGVIFFRIDWFDSLQSKEFSRVFSSTTVWKYHFLGAQLSLWFNSHIDTWLLEKPKLWLCGPLSAKWCLCFLKFCLGLS